MIDETRQAQLLDEYLSALQINPHAPIPSGLDPEMADFAQLITGEPITQNHNPTDERIWQRIQPHVPTNSTINIIERDSYMENIKQKKKNATNNRGWLPLVATVAVSVLVSLFLASIIFGGDDNNQPAVADVQIVTSTPLPSVSPMSASATPTSADFVLQPQNINPTPTFLPTVTPPMPMTELCDFEGELQLQLNQDTLSSDDFLIVTATIRNPETQQAIVEIFGGFLTDDQYREIFTTTSPALDNPFQVRIPESDDYPAGSYLVRLRLLDDEGEVLSSCGLPVTFTR